MRNINQFSLRTMMIAMSVIAVLCCIFFTLPDWLSVAFLLIAALLVMPATLAVVVYGDGKVQAFAIGTLPPLSIVFLWFTGLPGRYSPFVDIPDGGSLEFKVSVAIVTLIVATSGFVAQAVRWWCLARARSNAPDEIESPEEIGA